jgi:hypothetical protein
VDRRQSVPGLGTFVRGGLRDAMPESTRCPRGQAVVSDGQLGPWAKAAAGQRDGPSGTTSGHASLTGACSAAAVLGQRNPPAGHPSLARLATKHGKGKALTVWAPTLARAVSALLRRDPGGERPQGLHASGSGAGEPNASLAAPGRRRASRARLRPASANAQEPLGAGALRPGPGMGPPLRRLREGARGARCRWAAPPPTLDLTGTRPAWSPHCAEDGRRARRSGSAAEPRLPVALHSPARW